MNLIFTISLILKPDTSNFTLNIVLERFPKILSLNHIIKPQE